MGGTAWKGTLGGIDWVCVDVYMCGGLLCGWQCIACNYQRGQRFLRLHSWTCRAGVERLKHATTTTKCMRMATKLLSKKLNYLKSYPSTD